MADVIGGEDEGGVDESHLNVIVDFIPEDYGDDTELHQDNVLVQEITQNSNPSTEPKNSYGKSRINETAEEKSFKQAKKDYNPCAYADTDSMISLPFLAGGERYLPDAFKAIATAGKNLLQSFQQYIYEEECDAFMDSNDYNKNFDGKGQEETIKLLDRPKSKERDAQQGNRQNEPGVGKRGQSGEASQENRRQSGQEDSGPSGQEDSGPSGQEDNGPSSQEYRKPSGDEDRRPSGEENRRPSGEENRQPSGEKDHRPSGKEDQRQTGQEDRRQSDQEDRQPSVKEDHRQSGQEDRRQSGQEEDIPSVKETRRQSDQEEDLPSVKENRRQSGQEEDLPSVKETRRQSGQEDLPSVKENRRQSGQEERLPPVKETRRQSGQEDLPSDKENRRQSGQEDRLPSGKKDSQQSGKEGRRPSGDADKISGGEISARNDRRMSGQNEPRLSGEDAQNKQANRLQESEERGEKPNIPRVKSKERQQSNENEREKADLRRVKSQESQTDEVGQFNPSSGKENQGNEDTKSQGKSGNMPDGESGKSDVRSQEKSKDIKQEGDQPQGKTTENQRGPDGVAEIPREKPQEKTMGEEKSDRTQEKSKDRNPDESGEKSDMSRGKSTERQAGEVGKSDMSPGKSQEKPADEGEKSNRSRGKSTERQTEEGGKPDISRGKTNEGQVEEGGQPDMSKGEYDEEVEEGDQPDMSRGKSKERQAEEGAQPDMPRGKSKERQAEEGAQPDMPRGKSKERQAEEGAQPDMPRGKSKERQAEEGAQPDMPREKSKERQAEEGGQPDMSRGKSKERQKDEAAKADPQLLQTKASQTDEADIMQPQKAMQGNAPAQTQQEMPDESSEEGNPEKREEDEEEKPAMPPRKSIEKKNEGKVQSDMLRGKSNERKIIVDDNQDVRDINPKTPGEQEKTNNQREKSQDKAKVSTGENKRSKKQDGKSDNRRVKMTAEEDDDVEERETCGKNVEKADKASQYVYDDEGESPPATKKKEKLKDRSGDDEKDVVQKVDKSSQYIYDGAGENEPPRKEKRRKSKEKPIEEEEEQPRRRKSRDRNKSDEEENAERRRRKQEEQRQREEEERRQRDEDERRQNEEIERLQREDNERRQREEERRQREENRRRQLEADQMQKETEERAEKRRRKSEERRQKEAEAEQQRRQSGDERRKSKAEKKYKEEVEDEALVDRRRKSSEAKKREERTKGKQRKSREYEEEENDTRVQLYTAEAATEHEDRRIIVITEVDEAEELKRKQIKEKHMAIMGEMEERRRKSNETADQRNVELDAEMRKQMREAKKSLDFVDYFFKKDGFTYIGILTQMKLDFEQRAMLALSKASEAIQKNAKRYKTKVDALKKIIPVEKEKEIEEFNYPVVLEKDCRKFEIEIDDKIVHVTKFHKYALKLVLHWKYLIRENRELELLTVYEAATELLAGTMVLVFPIFVRLAAFIANLCDNPQQSMDAYSSKYLTDQIRKMVDTISDEIGAIEESTSIVMQQLPAKTPKEAEHMLAKLKSQAVHAKNSLSWAIKILGTILFHYNLLTILVQNGQYTSSLVKAEKQQPKAENTTAQKGGFTIEQQQTNKKGPAKDFVDVFFQREGFQFIGILTKLKMTYEDRSKSELQHASPKVREIAEIVAEKIHQIRKLTPPKEEKIIGEYDFPSAFLKEISEFEIDITDKLNTIKQFHKYTVKLIEHWSVDLESRVKIDPNTTYEVAIQLMAGLMALIYPILIKMANYLSKLAETPRSSRTHHPPERVARKLRKMVEAVTDELGAVGAACMKTSDKVCGPTSDIGKEIKVKIFSQMKHAKNSVSWGVKAISPALFYYFLRVFSDQERNA